MSNVFAQRSNFRRWLHRIPYSQERQSFGKIFDQLLDTAGWTDQPTYEDIPIDEYDLDDDQASIKRAHYRYNGIIYSRQSTHVGNSIVAYNRQGNTYYGCIQSITVLKSKQVTFEVMPYNTLNNQDDYFSRYAPHFPVQLLSTSQGEAAHVPISAILCHCARYHVSDEHVVLLQLSRVSCLK